MAFLDNAGVEKLATFIKAKVDAALNSGLATKQPTLVSGTNIKTLNYSSLLGSGNISVPTENDIGYTIRTSDTKVTAEKCYRYRLLFTSADGTKWVPVNTSTSTSSTATKTLNTRPIDPFGPIIYYSGYSAWSSDIAALSSQQWLQYGNITIGYSYVKTLTKFLPVYLKCTPQADGSVVMADVVQAKPTTNDGYIYILLGVASSTTEFELQLPHPVYWHDGTGIRLWTGGTTS